MAKQHRHPTNGKPLLCPNCGHKVIKAGMAESGTTLRQRYRCRIKTGGCGKTTIIPVTEWAAQHTMDGGLEAVPGRPGPAPGQEENLPTSTPKTN